MTASVDDQVRDALATLLSLPLAEVTVQTTQAGLDAWDSIAHLSFVLELEQRFHIALLPEQVERMTSVASAIREVTAALERSP